MGQGFLFDLPPLLQPKPIAKYSPIHQKRSDIITLDSAPAIFSVLSTLPLGSIVPSNVFISDHKNGGILSWIVQERKVGEIIQVLTLLDAETIEEDIFGRTKAIACEVFTAPAKTLKAPEYVWTSGPDCKKRRDKLCDIRQMARAMNDRRRHNTQEKRADDLDNRGNPSQSARSS